MIALMLAAVTVSAAPVETPAIRQGTLREIPAACQEGRVMAVDRAPPARASKLADMPKAHLMLPVVRSVEGCAVPTFVRYDVERDGRFANPAR